MGEAGACLGVLSEEVSGGCGWLAWVALDGTCRVFLEGIDGVDFAFLCMFLEFLVIRLRLFVCRVLFCICMLWDYHRVYGGTPFVCQILFCTCMLGDHYRVYGGAPFVLCWAAKEDLEFGCVVLLLVVL